LAGCCECGDEPSGSGATELVTFICGNNDYNNSNDNDCITTVAAATTITAGSVQICPIGNRALFSVVEQHSGKRELYV
jgi:hypothetical protein